MEKRLTADLNVVANSNLEIQLLDGDLNIIQKLDDEPNDVGGLTSAELKAKFDESGNIIKKYINETLIPAVLTDDATEESRKQAEAARVAAEQGRVTAEEGRVSAETARAAAEQARSEAEASRVSAENARAAAETARADETAGIVARATEHANAAAGSASQAAGSEQSAKDAAGTATGAAISASQSETAASGSASQASAAAAAAAGSAAGAETASKTAQSWAVGGTGTRPGEDTDNAKYWAEKAQAVVGGDFATKVEAQGYVTAHNESNVAHSDIRKALEGKAAATHASQHGKDGADPITPAAIGAASLGADGKVPASQLPETNTYTKDEILKDATAAKFGKDTGAVPDEVLDVLSKSVLEGTYPVVDVYAGQNWEKGTVPNVSGSVWQAIAVANNILFSFPISGTTAVMSTDGKTWTTFTIPTVSGGYNYGGRHRIVYADDTYYLLIPITSSPYKAIIYATQNLSTWTLKCTLSLTNIAYNLFYSNYLSKFVLIDISGKVYLSSDAENWENTYNLGTSASGLNNGIDGPDGFYIAAQVSKKFQVIKLKSDSFETVFTSADLPNTRFDVAFVKFKGKYFAYTPYGIAHSEDLKEWQLSDANYQSSETNVTTIMQQLACSDVNVLIKFGLESLVSFDGLNFKRITDSVSSQQGSMAYINGVFCFHSQGAPSAINPCYTPDTTFKDEPGLVDVLGNMVNIPLKQIAGAASIETGTYTGTGANTLTLRTNSKPKIMLLCKEIFGSSYYPHCLIALLPDELNNNVLFLPSIIFKGNHGATLEGAPVQLTTLSDNVLKIDTDGLQSAEDIFNASGTLYRFLFLAA